MPSNMTLNEFQDREHMRALCANYLKMTRWADGWRQMEKGEPGPTQATIERREFCKRYLERV